MDNTSKALEENGPELFVDSADQKKKVAKEPEANIEYMKMVSKETAHPMVLIIMPHPENPTRSSGNNFINQKASKEQIIDVPHIDFIFKDRRRKLEDCTQIWEILRLKYLKGKSHILEVSNVSCCASTARPTVVPCLSRAIHAKPSCQASNVPCFHF